MNVDAPRTLFGWFPQIWTKTLFPAQLERDSRLRGWAIAVLILFPALLLYPTRDYHLFEPDESRYAQIGKEMYTDSEWIIPTLQSKPYLDKPPMFYWVVHLSYRLFGVSDEAARFGPSLAVHLTILLIYLLGRRSVGHLSAFWGALLLSVMPGFVGMGRLLILDGLLTMWVTLAILTGFEAVRGGVFRWKWWLSCGIVCGFAGLTKGPVVFLLMIPPLVLHLALNRQHGVLTVWRVMVLGLMALLINLPWYVAIYMKQPEFLRYFFWEHNVKRFVQPFDHLEPVWYYAPILLGGLFCSTILLIHLLWKLTRVDLEFESRRTPEMGFWLLCGGWCVFFFSMSGCKLPTYILPAFPCLALALGDFVVQTKWRNSWLPRFGVGFSAALLFFAFYVAIPWYARERSPMGRPELVAKYCADPEQPVYSFPRNCDSVAFYLGREDLISVRSKQSQVLIEDMLKHERSVVLFTHRHSLQTLKLVLPKQLKIVEEVSLRRHKTAQWVDRLAGDSPWGLCDMAVIERIDE
jgi:4-amino-4-deoxy-L-arabinose transferase-like glycosyltransferase